MYKDRINWYRQLEKHFNSKVIVYATGTRSGASARIASDVIDFFVNHLDGIGDTKKISLYLYTNGGSVGAAWNIVNLLRMYCDELQVIVPRVALSAGTLICLGADEILMTKQATLGPIDPSIPYSTTSGDTEYISVEEVKSYLDFAKDEIHITDEHILADVFKKLSDSIPPISLGRVYRTRGQIKMIANKLLIHQNLNDSQKAETINFLCTDSGSHDYTINRREARDDLHLNIAVPKDEDYALIKKIYDDISDELKLNDPFILENVDGSYSNKICLLESVKGGSDYYLVEGYKDIGTDENGDQCPQYVTSFSGWRHDRDLKVSQTVELPNNNNENGEDTYEKLNDIPM